MNFARIPADPHIRFACDAKAVPQHQVFFGAALRIVESFFKGH